MNGLETLILMLGIIAIGCLIYFTAWWFLAVQKKSKKGHLILEVDEEEGFEDDEITKTQKQLRSKIDEMKNASAPPSADHHEENLMKKGGGLAGTGGLLATGILAGNLMAGTRITAAGIDEPDKFKNQENITGGNVEHESRDVLGGGVTSTLIDVVGGDGLMMSSNNGLINSDTQNHQDDIHDETNSSGHDSAFQADDITDNGNGF